MEEIMIVLFVLFWLLVGLATTIPEAKDIMRIANIGDRVICYLIFAAAGPVLLIAGFFS
jgi:Ca2+/Na+ antiporter